jgi:hypothetical protein
MAWSVQGTYFENCNCDFVCPCIVSGLTEPATQDRCNNVFAFHVDRGEVDGVDVSGKSVVLVLDAPAMMGEGNWRVGLIMDATASPEQADALAGVLSGQLGGPMAMLAPLIGEMMGMEYAPIDYVDDGVRHSVKVGDLVDVEIEDVVIPGNESGEILRLSGVVHPVGSTITLAKGARGRVEAFGLSFGNAGKNGHSAPFAWSS